MLIYRIENAKRQGPYNNKGSILQEHSSRVPNDRRHPPPEYDHKLGNKLREIFKNEMFPEKYRFGFSSVEQAQQWVYKRSWCVALRKAGFKLSCFEVPDEFCIQGDKQVMYEIKRVKTSTRSKQCIMESLWTKRK